MSSKSSRVGTCALRRSERKVWRRMPMNRVSTPTRCHIAANAACACRVGSVNVASVLVVPTAAAACRRRSFTSASGKAQVGTASRGGSTGGASAFRLVGAGSGQGVRHRLQQRGSRHAPGGQGRRWGGAKEGRQARQRHNTTSPRRGSGRYKPKAQRRPQEGQEHERGTVVRCG